MNSSTRNEQRDSNETKNNTCSFCDYHHSVIHSPACGQTCIKCGVIGHYARVSEALLEKKNLILQEYCKDLEKQRRIWYRQEMEKANRRKPPIPKNCWTADIIPPRVSVGSYDGWFYDKDGIVTVQDHDCKSRFQINLKK